MLQRSNNPKAELLCGSITSTGGSWLVLGLSSILCKLGMGGLCKQFLHIQGACLGRLQGFSVTVSRREVAVGVLTMRASGLVV